MSAIQLILLVLIVAVVAGAYFYIRSQAGDDPWEDMDDAARDREAERGESLDGDSYVVGVRAADDERAAHAPPQPTAVEQVPAAPKAPDKGHTDKAGPKPPAGDSKLVILHVACRGDDYFDGPDVHAALQGQHLAFGAKEIYHRLTETGDVSVYSVANMIKPGFLDPAEQDHLSTPGLTMFLMLPGPWEGSKALRDMLETAGALAQRLGGEVLDDSRALLKPQTAQFMLDEVAEMDRKRRVQAAR